MKRRFLTGIAIVQLVLGLRLIAKLFRTARGKRIAPTLEAFPPSVTVLLPVLNEADRVIPCLARLIASGQEIAAIVVVDGGSTDRTVEIVRQFQLRDDRISLVETRPDVGVNGKAHGLDVGLQFVRTEWVLTIDADVRPDPGLLPALPEHAKTESLSFLSVATRQWLADRFDQIVHPAMLSTLIYRFGIPGHATRDRSVVQANGQCMLIRRELLERLGGFAPYAHTIAEDVGLARAAARAGERVGFYETDDLVSVEMYSGGLETVRNWSRSLPLGESQTRQDALLNWASLFLLQAAPPFLAALAGKTHPRVRSTNHALLAVRFGILAGSRRAYRNPGALFWLSPLADLPVVTLLAVRARQRSVTWRGRIVQRGDLRCT